ncbi:MAG: hypothetical protein QMC98_00285 [Candidatus Thermoplasmatota archaeon]|nr:hypothetical protein [Candidatus Thermoplasmatota archaeon]
MYGDLPLPGHELVKFRKELKPYEYKIVEEGGKKILVASTPNVYPDIVNDLENIVEKVDSEDAKNLTNVCIIGEREVLGVDTRILEALLIKRKKSDDAIVARLRKKLNTNLRALSFEDEDDVHKIKRLALKIPNDANNYKEYLWEFSQVDKDAKIIYIIGNNNYVRLTGEHFYELLSSKEQVIDKIKSKFLACSYELVSLEGANIDLAAKKSNRRIIVKYCRDCSLEDAKNINDEAERLRADVCFVIVNKISKEVKKFALGKKIELFELDELENLEL